MCIDIKNKKQKKAIIHKLQALDTHQCTFIMYHKYSLKAFTLLNSLLTTILPPYILNYCMNASKSVEIINRILALLYTIKYTLL